MPINSRVRTRSQTRCGAQHASVQAIPNASILPLKPKLAALSKPRARARPKSTATTRQDKSTKAPPQVRSAVPLSNLAPTVRSRPYTRSVAAAERAMEAIRGPDHDQKARASSNAVSSKKAAPLPAPRTPPRGQPALPPFPDFVIENESSGSKAGASEITRTVMQELHSIESIDGAFLQGLYTDVVSESKIEDFLSATLLYDHGKHAWTGIPRDCQDEENLLTPLRSIIDAIVNGLGDVNGTRRVVDTRTSDFLHADEASHTSKPLISVLATGPSFQKPKTLTGEEQADDMNIGFSNTASIFQITRDTTSFDNKHIEQLAILSREIMINQPNRLFCRSLLITEARVLLLHYDHSGAYRTGFVDIHDDPRTFIRLVLGLSSVEEEVLGLDTSVQWVIENGVKVGGTISTLDASGKRVAYALQSVEPIFSRDVVRGRGTVCWAAKDATGSPVIIKDLWRADMKGPEHEFLERAKGLRGVVQMVSFEDDRAQTKDFRPETYRSDDFYNRTLSRITMQRYGASLAHSPSQWRAIAALRDAIQGHLNLVKSNVLHRDVSTENVLLSMGEEGAPSGQRGILIDLDMAAPVKGERALFSVEGRVGTWLYQSSAVLKSGADSDGLAHVDHDYLDDLESFFYVLCHLLYGFDSIGVAKSDADLAQTAPLGRWEIQDATMASNSKVIYIHSQGTFIPPAAFWSQPCLYLCDKFRRFIGPLILEKINIRAPMRSAARKALLDGLHSGMEDHYSQVLSFFDEALEELAKPGGEAPRRPLSASTTSSLDSPRRDANPPPAPVNRGVKRSIEDVEALPNVRRTRSRR
ncbi:hypothetical protein D9611_006100 [Ephemerocybe angulata]|uniref:Fungal-type protein kinase domain-containing protein n=1 Tax=Ephemerocybe angulata TaxID=980116 RepID=A0A8H5FKV1_9AGAR|nr:hypothetical protein D9611_006100 [Tulosesus angulatus]